MLKRFRRARVVLHTRKPDDQSVRGVLTGVYRDCVVLDHAEYLEGERAVGVPGQIVVPRDNVAFFQVVG